MIFITSVYLTQIVADYRASDSEGYPGLAQYYGSLGSSLLSLFQATSGGNDWDDLVTPLRNALSPAMAFFILSLCSICNTGYAEFSNRYIRRLCAGKHQR